MNKRLLKDIAKFNSSSFVIKGKEYINYLDTSSITEKTKYYPKYIYYNLSQQTNTDYLQNIAQTNVSSYPSINDIDLMGLKLLIVGDITRQKRVADVLSALDDKIELNNKVNQELEKTAKDLYNYWFVQFDFPDGNKRPLLSRIFNFLKPSAKLEVQNA